MTPDPLPVALPELPTVATMYSDPEYGFPGSPGSMCFTDDVPPGRITQSWPLVRKSDAEAALRAQAEEVERLRADAERYRWLRDKAISRLCIDHTRDMYDGGNRLELVVPIAQRYSQEDDVTLDAAIDAHLASKQEKP